jgi:hypothetical protein
MENLPFLQLSQTHLQILETCPRKFQHCFLDYLTLPQPSLVSEKQILGTQFHQLMQQRALGLDIQPLLDDNPKLQAWLCHFQEAPPPLITGQSRQSEYQCTLDLLIQGSTQVQIVDWKTYRRPPQAQLLRQHWQTRLYLFMAAEALGYSPAQVSMVYWFAESTPGLSAGKTAESWLSIPYTESMHQETQETLQRLLVSLGGWMQDFADHHRDFPQVPLDAKKCFSSTQSCAFVNQCYPNRNSSQTDLADLMDLAAIAEVSLE